MALCVCVCMLLYLSIVIGIYTDTGLIYFSRLSVYSLRFWTPLACEIATRLIASNQMVEILPAKQTLSWSKILFGVERDRPWPSRFAGVVGGRARQLGLL